MTALRLPLFAMLLAAAPAQAQEAAAPAPAEDGASQQGEYWGGNEIVVTGRNQSEISERVVTLQARTISSESVLRHSPLAMFADAACPGVMGLKRDYAEALVGRIRLIAEELKIPLAEAGSCRPNVLIVFTEDGRADLERINRRTKEISDALSVAERKALLSDTGPVHVYSTVEDRMRNGQRIPKRRNLVEIPTGSQEGGQSRISNGVRRVITGVTVLYDRGRIGQYSLIQLADYAAMRVFARTQDARGEHAPDSILSLFNAEEDAPPPGLTAFDRAFLTTLYDSHPYTSAQGNLQRVAQTLKKQVGADE